MLFSSNSFLFLFLPTVVFAYYILFRRSRNLQNIFLFLSSLLFYAWGEPYFVAIMMISIVINWSAGLMVAKYMYVGNVSRAKIALIMCVAINLIILFIFKYLSFTLESIDKLLHVGIRVPDIALPIGISFFTFQAISYVVDVYREKGCAQKNILNVGLYISFFPQLIAGPIVRYETVAEQILNRRETIDSFCAGIHRFVIGFCKKILLANNLAIVADKAFNLLDDGTLSCGMAWLGALAYTFQIFYDFSGYSDMAIGLGKIFGFQFLENFNYPYISSSITEFWRRWHISLGTWFRDYVYIPLGGSRVGAGKQIRNLFIVWFCTGIWHGANWTFVIWGLMYFVLLIFEKKTGIVKNQEKHKLARRIYTMFFVIMGWILFRADDVSSAIMYYKTCFGIGIEIVDSNFIEYARQYVVYFATGAMLSTPIFSIVKEKIRESRIINVVYAAGVIVLFAAAISFLVKGSYNPFIYFNF